MAMYRTIVALGLIARFQDLYREEVRGRVNDQVNQYCYISSLQDVDHRKGVGAGIIDHIRDRWDFTRTNARNDSTWMTFCGYL